MAPMAEPTDADVELVENAWWDAPPCGHNPMSTEPRAAADRAAKRAAIRRDHLAWAERASLVANRSIKCAGSDWWSPRHADVDGGCRNDGTTCLCECHDAEGGSDG